MDDVAPISCSKPGLSILLKRLWLFFSDAHLLRQRILPRAIIGRFEQCCRPDALVECPPPFLLLAFIHDELILGNVKAASDVYIQLCQRRSVQDVYLGNLRAWILLCRVVIDRSSHDVLATHMIHPGAAEYDTGILPVCQKLTHRVTALQRTVSDQPKGRRENLFFLIVQQREFPVQLIKSIPAHAEHDEVRAVHIHGILKAAAIDMSRRFSDL